MGFQLNQHPSVYIHKILVHAYVIKMLRSIENSLSLISTVEFSARNYRATLAQGGVRILKKKSLKESIHVEWSFENQAHKSEFTKSMLITEAYEMINCIMDPKRKGSVLLI